MKQLTEGAIQWACNSISECKKCKFLTWTQEVEAHNGMCYKCYKQEVT